MLDANETAVCQLFTIHPVTAPKHLVIPSDAGNTYPGCNNLERCRLAGDFFGERTFIAHLSRQQSLLCFAGAEGS